jgi:hypothetical protein
MARQPDLSKWQLAWEHLSVGGSAKAAGINKQLALNLRKLINAGWKWAAVHKRIVGEGISIARIVEEMERGEAPPPVSKEDVAAAEAVIPPPEEIEVITPTELAEIVQASTPIMIPAAKRRQILVTRQREHKETEIKIADRLNDFANRLLDNASPYIIPKRKVSRREDRCPHCTKPVTVEEVHIHPAKIDYGGIAKLFKEASERKRVALGMPKQHLSVKVSDVHSEVADRLRDVDEAFKAAFQHGIERGLVSEQGALEIWERARAQIEGKHV